MKRLFLCAALLLPTSASAEQDCVSVEEAHDLLGEQYGEQRIVAGLAENGRTIEFWLNPTTPSWSLVAVEGDTACLVAFGADWTFAPITKQPNL